jgi:hypothetical protein
MTWSLFIYFERLVIASGRTDLALVRPRLLTYIFIGLDAVAFAMLIIGRGFVDSDFFSGALKAGNYILLVGLLLEMLLLHVFTFFAIHFQIRLARCRPLATQNAETTKQLKRLCMLIWAAAQIIAGRDLSRLTTTALNSTGYMAKHEWAFFAFESVQVAQAMCFCFAWYFWLPTGYAPAPMEITSIAGSDQEARSVPPPPPLGASELPATTNSHEKVQVNGSESV